MGPIIGWLLVTIGIGAILVGEAFFVRLQTNPSLHAPGSSPWRRWFYLWEDKNWLPEGQRIVDRVFSLRLGGFLVAGAGVVVLVLTGKQ